MNKTLLVLLIAGVILVNARPSHLGDNNQLTQDQENNQPLELGLKPWQIEMLAQKLEEINELGNDDYAFKRPLRGGSHGKFAYRPQCFLNPVSCFKK